MDSTLPFDAENAGLLLSWALKGFVGIDVPVALNVSLAVNGITPLNYKKWNATSLWCEASLNGESLFLAVIETPRKGLSQLEGIDDRALWDTLRKIPMIPGVKRALLYGSFASGRQLPGSDIDVAIEIMGGIDSTMRRKTLLDVRDLIEKNLPRFADVREIFPCDDLASFLGVYKEIPTKL